MEKRADHIFGFSISTVITFISQIVIIAGAFYGLKYGLSEERIFRENSDKEIMTALINGKNDRLMFTDKVEKKLSEMTQLFSNITLTINDLKSSLDFKATGLEKNMQYCIDNIKNDIKNNEKAIGLIEKKVDCHEGRLNELSLFKEQAIWFEKEFAKDRKVKGEN
jgi:hypothetical protein